MARATGVGGVFLRAADPEKLHAWYEEHLGIKRTEDGAFAFFSEGPREMTVFAFFPMDTKYFGPTGQRAMVNLRVEDLDAVLAKLWAASVEIDPRREDHDYGRFAWFNDPEGNRVELWQPQAQARPRQQTDEKHGYWLDALEARCGFRSCVGPRTRDALYQGTTLVGT